MVEGKGSRWSLAITTITLLIGMIFVLVQIPSSVSQGTVEISFGDVTHETLDMDKDGKFEYLIVEVKLNVFVPGNYGLHGDLGYGIIANSGPFEFGIGENPIELKFSGGSISRSFIVGTLNIDLEAYSRDIEVGSIEMTYEPGILLDPDDFEPPTGGIGTEVRIVGEEVVLQNPKMEVRMNMTSPKLSFTYPGEVGLDKVSSIEYLEMIAYDDINEDGIWDQAVDEMKYSADLEDVDWEIETDFTKGYDISLFGVIQLKLAGTSTIAGWARMTFSLSSEYMTMEPPSQKFDIDIDLWQQLDAEMIAVRHVFKDDSGNFQLKEGIDEETGDTTITVMKNEKRAYGTYSWTEDIMTGDFVLKEVDQAETWFSIDGSEASVWFSYPLGNSTRLIHHDPRMSMDPKIPTLDEEDEFLGNSPIVMLLGTMAGILLVGGSFFLRNYKKRIDRDRYEGGDV